MKRLFNNLLVDVIAAGLMVGMIATGYILRFPLPPGSNKSLSLWGFTRHQWGTLHSWLSLALLAIVLLHLALHWPWVVVTVKRRLWGTVATESPVVIGLMSAVALAVVLLLFGWIAQYSVTTITQPDADACPPDASTDTSQQHLTKGATAPKSPANVDFWTGVYPVLEHSCLSCHGPGKQSGGFRIDRRTDFLRTDAERLVVPGDSAGSPLIAIVSGQRKDISRQDVHHLSEENVRLLRAWIDAGAIWPERPVPHPSRAVPE